MNRNRTQAAGIPPGTNVASSDMLTGTHLVDPLNVDLKHLDKQIENSAETSLQELRDSLNAVISADPSDPAFKKYTDDSKFMDEEVLIRVHPSTDPAAEKIVDVYNNGTPQRFIRGVWVICKRKYVEVLARAKPFSVQTPEYQDDNGDRARRIDTTTGSRYPFEMRDRNPYGDAWLSHILQEA